MRIDLNADVGEGCDDLLLMPHLTSVNVACGWASRHSVSPLSTASASACHAASTPSTSSARSAPSRLAETRKLRPHT